MPPCPKMRPIRDKQYQRRAKYMNCAVPGCYDTETIVLAHIRIAGNAGTAFKPSDDCSLYLCHQHHDEMDGRRARDAWNTCEWIVRNIVLPQRKQAYRAWKMGVGR